MESAENIIVLRSVYGKVNMKYYINPCKDPKTGRFPDCVRTVDSFGNMILSDKDKNNNEVLIPETKAYIFEDGKTFNLLDPWDKADWECVKNCPLIAQSRDARNSKGELLIDGDTKGGLNARYGAAELYIERPGVETVKKVSRRKKIHDAETYIYQDKNGAEGRLKMTRLLGKNLKSLPDADITDYLLEVASKTPDKIIDLYTGDDMVLRLLFIDARDKNVIFNKNKLFIYGDNVILGATDDAVITWMRDSRNYKILQLIKKDTYPDMYDFNDSDESIKPDVKESKAASTSKK